MKNILISFIRNNHLELYKEENVENLDITDVVQKSSIDRLFLLTNKNREESISFKNWIAEKLDIEVKAVTLEKGSEKYILNKIESIIKYILLAEEGHARFFYLPGENTLQINLWEIVNQNIYKGKIIYPGNKNPLNEKNTPVSQPVKSAINLSQTGITKEPIPVDKAVLNKKTIPLNKTELPPQANRLDKGVHVINRGTNLLIWGEEGTGKKTLALSILEKSGKEYFSINLRTLNPSKIDSEFETIIEDIENKKYHTLLLLNVEILPFYIQEKFTILQDIQIISTFNMTDDVSLEDLNKRFYYLISSYIIPMAPLRSRKEELSQFVENIMEKNGTKAEITDKALFLLQNHKWPGNFNEFNSVISRALMESSTVINEDLIDRSMDNIENEVTQWQSTPIEENFKLNDLLGDVAMHYIMQALEMAEGKKLKAARLLGFSNYQTLSNWIKKYEK
jgi:transcriptional regulator of acetoin/glycerol metabolism